jgi:hypothetical protein
MSAHEGSSPDGAPTDSTLEGSADVLSEDASPTFDVASDALAPDVVLVDVIVVEDSGPETPCDGGQDLCDGGCVSLQSIVNCGACGVVCPSDVPHAMAVCAEGVCGTTCNAGYNPCDGACVPYSTADNCGRCGNACDVDGGAACAVTNDGVYSCVYTCPSYAPQLCGTSCVDLTSDPNNCSACADACTTTIANAHGICVNSSCSFACDSGYTLCNGACVQYTTAQNCGSCGHACNGDAGDVCAGSAGSYSCVSGCPSAAPDLCSGACVNTKTDPDNCNGCGIACALGVQGAQTLCEDGGCISVCSAGTANCGGTCTSLATAANCGSCGNACPTEGGTPLCAPDGDSGVYHCVSGCPESASALCNGACVDVATDTNNCGECGHACSTSVVNATPSCVAGACSFTCNSGYTLCNGACVDFSNDPNNCGGCGSMFACSGGATCQSGQCKTSCTITANCPAGYACNGSTCTTSCSSTQTCNGGCCNNGTCVAGMAANACGTNGGACTNCAAQPNNLACVAGACGCNVATDCQSMNACSLPLHSCESLCGGANTGCNGGCCSNMATGGQCMAGNTDTVCGGTGGQCQNCSSTCSPGPHCLNSACGCSSNLLFNCATMACGMNVSCSDAGACTPP